MHTRKIRRKIKRIIKRTIWSILLCLTVVLIFTSAWKLTTYAVHKLFPTIDGYHGSMEASSPESNRDEETSDVFAENTDSIWNEDSDILLVNKDHPLADTYEPTLVSIAKYGVQVDQNIYYDLCEMLKAGEKEGLCFWIASAYRSPKRQRELLDEDIEELLRSGYSYSEAYEEAVRETMPVGCSEHATGLAVDIVAKDYQILDKKQAQTDEIKWLQENCSQYGFILRYPEGKEDITKVDYESWHFRYIGVEAAMEIMEQGITLEEYLHPEDYD